MMAARGEEAVARRSEQAGAHGPQPMTDIGATDTILERQSRRCRMSQRKAVDRFATAFRGRERVVLARRVHRCMPEHVSDRIEVMPIIE